MLRLGETSRQVLRYLPRGFTWYQYKYVTLRTWVQIALSAFSRILLFYYCALVVLDPDTSTYRKINLYQIGPRLRTSREYKPGQETTDDHTDKMLLSVV